MSNAENPSERGRPRLSFSQRAGRIACAAVGLWLIWSWDGPGEKSVNFSTVATPKDTVELVTLAPGTEFILEGTVRPAGTATGERWEGRFVFLQTERRKLPEESGWSTVVLRDVRPAFPFQWSGGVLNLSANGYGLRYAPKIPAASSNQIYTGFKPGESAVVHGVRGADGCLTVRQLAAGPRAAYERRVARSESGRSWLGLGLRAFLSLVVLSFASSAWGGGGKGVTLP